jgi:hypothetical protein
VVKGKVMSDVGYAEFPKFLQHDTLPGVIAATAEAEAKYREQGYEPAGRSDPKAFEQRFSGAPGGYQPQRYPMWIDGCLVNDEREEKAARAGKLKPVDPYPMTITMGLQQIVVKDRADHERLIGGQVDTPSAPKPDMPSAAEWAEFQAAKAAGAMKGEAA